MRSISTKKIGKPSPRRTPTTTSTPSTRSSPTAAARRARTWARLGTANISSCRAEMQGQPDLPRIRGNARRPGSFFVNGKELGLFENGVTAYGLDVTDAVHFGDADNVLAVQIDNTDRYVEKSPPTPASNGKPKISTPTTAASTTTSGSTSWAASTRRCRCTRA